MHAKFSRPCGLREVALSFCVVAKTAAFGFIQNLSVAVGSLVVMFLGLRSLIYPTVDLAAAKAWYTEVLGVEPYFDEPFYVGFDVGGYELGLWPGGTTEAGPLTYWGVANVDDALAHLVASGADVFEDVSEVGGGIRMASVKDPFGLVFGIIENPNFSAAKVKSDGPGR